MSINACAFIGHRDCFPSMYETLFKTIKTLIVGKDILTFYVGCNGSFDFLVRKALDELKKEFQDLNYYIVISYLHEAKNFPDQNNTLYPEGIESTPYKYAILWRNKWMVNRCDYLICYINHLFGGAASTYEYAKRKNKKYY